MPKDDDVGNIPRPWLEPKPGSAVSIGSNADGNDLPTVSDGIDNYVKQGPEDNNTKVVPGQRVDQGDGNDYADVQGGQAKQGAGNDKADVTDGRVQQGPGNDYANVGKGGYAVQGDGNDKADIVSGSKIDQGAGNDIASYTPKGNPYNPGRIGPDVQQGDGDDILIVDATKPQGGTSIVADGGKGNDTAYIIGDGKDIHVGVPGPKSPQLTRIGPDGQRLPPEPRKQDPDEISVGIKPHGGLPKPSEAHFRGYENIQHIDPSSPLPPGTPQSVIDAVEKIKEGNKDNKVGAKGEGLAEGTGVIAPSTQDHSTAEETIKQL